MQATPCNDTQHLRGQIARVEDMRFPHLGLTDQKSLTDHFASLSPEDLRFRFGSPVSEAWVANYAAGITEGPGQVLVGWSDGNIFALGELRPAHRGAEDECEIALSVLKSCRNQGHGTALFNALLENAKAIGFVHAHLQVLHENRPMRRICKGKKAHCARFGPELIYSIATEPNQMTPLVI